MTHRQSTYAKLGLPGAFGEAVLILTLVLLLAPYLAGADLGIFKIPELSVPAQHFLRYLGPVLFCAAVLLYYPIWPRQALSVRSAGTDDPVTVRFENRTRNYVNIDWLDFEGKRDAGHHYVVEPGASKDVQTYVAHAWVVSNANSGAEIRTIVVAKDATRVSIT